ncbi:MAG TPA: hypothetical protein VGX26_10370 [Solirubrobacteraceae bacterium]|nr:hypothetical protein [Solirubrobacteraceae bacterium]
MTKRRYALAVVVVALAVLGVTSCGGGHPNRDYAVFVGCPLSNPATSICIFAQTQSGALTIGSKTIVISRTVTVQGGVHQDEATGRQEFLGARDGNALSRSPQLIPGGLRGIRADVTATIELAGPASRIGVSTQSLIEAKGIGLSLPVKVKLSNPLLGASCYIGSNAHPVVISLTTGTTRSSRGHRPLTGKPGHAKFRDEYNLTTISGESLVSDSFAAPRAEGCGGMNATVDAALGLPVAVGGNEAILNGTLRDANAPAVKASS